MTIWRFAVAGAVLASVASAARADDATIDCTATGVVPPHATGSHALSLEVPADVPTSPGWSSPVALAVIVGNDGIASGVHVDTSSGFASVDESITKAVHEHWRYAPATKNGSPIACRSKTWVRWSREPAPETSKPPYNVLHLSATDYPPAVLAKKEEGAVGLMVFIDDDNKKVVARVIISSRFPDLDAASIDFVTHRAHLTAAQINGSPAKTVIGLDLQWSIAPPMVSADRGLDDHPPTPKLMIREVSPPCSPATQDNGEFYKRGTVLFEHDASSPTAAQLPAMKLFASDLAEAIEAGAISVQLRGYAGDTGDESRDSCRLSMDRAISIRQLLIGSQLREDQIKVVALGGIPDEGEPDRVDIYVQTK